MYKRQVLYKEDGSVFSVGSTANGQMGTGDFRDPRFVLPVQSGDQENRSVKPSWLNVVKMDGSNMEYGGTTGRLVPDYFTLYIDGTNSDRLEIDRAKMLECYSAGFNLYTDTEVNSISNWAAVTMTVDDGSIGQLNSNGSIYTLSDPYEKAGPVILTITYTKDGQSISSQIRVTFVKREAKAVDPIVAVGNDHNVALDQKGNIWVWGDNKVGQLGTGDNTQYEYPFNLTQAAATNAGLTVPTGINKVYAGNGYTLLLDETGKHLYMAGKGSSAFVEVAPGTNVRAAAAYGEYYIYLNDDGVYVNGVLQLLPAATTVSDCLLYTSDAADER